MVDIIAVDDESTITGFLKVFFKMKGWDTRIFNNPQEALDYIKDNPVKVIMTDINMPEMNGLEFSGKARNLCPALPVIAFTGSIDSFEIPPGTFDQIIEKPASIQQLSKVIEPYLKKSNHRSESGKHDAIKI
jgi:two-component system response regulator YesN